MPAERGRTCFSNVAISNEIPMLPTERISTLGYKRDWYLQEEGKI